MGQQRSFALGTTNSGGKEGKFRGRSPERRKMSQTSKGGQKSRGPYGPEKNPSLWRQAGGEKENSPGGCTKKKVVISRKKTKR